MKQVTKFAASCVMLLGLTVFVAADSHAAESSRAAARAAKSLAKVCKSSITLKGGQALVKGTAGGHITPADPRNPGYSLICGSLCARSFPAPVYYSDGTLAFKLGYYGRFSGNGQPRAYCGTGGAPVCSVRSVYATAKRKKSGAAGYLPIGGGKCAKLDLSGKRNGDV